GEASHPACAGAVSRSPAVPGGSAVGKVQSGVTGDHRQAKAAAHDDPATADGRAPRHAKPAIRTDTARNSWAGGRIVAVGGRQARQRGALRIVTSHEEIPRWNERW